MVSLIAPFNVPVLLPMLSLSFREGREERAGRAIAAIAIRRTSKRSELGIEKYGYGRA